MKQKALLPLKLWEASLYTFPELPSLLPFLPFSFHLSDPKKGMKLLSMLGSCGQSNFLKTHLLNNDNTQQWNDMVKKLTTWKKTRMKFYEVSPLQFDNTHRTEGSKKLPLVRTAEPGLSPRERLPPAHILGACHTWHSRALVDTPHS